MSKIKIAIVDDHQLFRDGLAGLLLKHEYFELLASLPDGESLLQFLEERESPDIILLDLTMPGLGGFEVLKRLKKHYKKIRSIVISMHEDGNYIVKCAKAGAYGYLLKNADEDELLTAIHKVYRGERYYNDDISARMFQNLSLQQSIPEKLTKREIEVLHHLAEGLTTKEMAEKMFISTRTIETHRANMLKKLDVKNTAELIKRATQLHLLS
ncbi:response regulator [Flavilitoribacter nigricans]|uniref:DNA-binding response regulator n=1 Tax=Flavilitoribacter nigricans (strain ATCC 23147 / DSM 23189 / NBRC 102662 / NCIMB 1420 / SS-2) TaxID=1122177 RepID=A0A2D0N1Y0_FLAN2|nr:response regulator transcription factor [Flavilitoribacter nigricans]PHN02398.1 DNA-binding response regulator [Flavilitoribacter nigricans DSM 23189 = NBRC 102662]